MMTIRNLMPGALLLLTLAAVPDSAEAQGRGNGRGRAEQIDRRDGDRDRSARDRTVWEDILRGDREPRGERRGNGPPFCRDGRGHPVHGMQWCREKGWDYRRDRLDDIIFGDRSRDRRIWDLDRRFRDRD